MRNIVYIIRYSLQINTDDVFSFRAKRYKFRDRNEQNTITFSKIVISM